MKIPMIKMDQTICMQFEIITKREKKYLNLATTQARKCSRKEGR
jgi:hypothetical protein